MQCRVWTVHAGRALSVGTHVHLEREQQALGRSGLSEDDWMAAQEPVLAAIVGSGRHPLFARMLTTLSAQGYDLVLGKVF